MKHMMGPNRDNPADWERGQVQPVIPIFGSWPNDSIDVPSG